MATSFFNGNFFSGEFFNGSAPSAGVKKAPVVIRLSDLKERESTADYIKSFLANQRKLDEEKEVVFRAGKKTERQRKDEIDAQLAMEKMRREAEQRQERNTTIRQ